MAVAVQAHRFVADAAAEHFGAALGGGARHVGVVEPLDAPESLAEQLPFERAQRRDLGAVEAEGLVAADRLIDREVERRAAVEANDDCAGGEIAEALALRRGDDRDEADDVAPRQYVHGAQQVAHERRARRQRQSVGRSHAVRPGACRSTDRR